jgi:DNA segregation ATPase FtsK/SpoIIIE-like protein
MDSWAGGALPLGMGMHGLITAADVTPHLLVAGTTGSGKSRYMLRPIMAAALADNWQVIALDKSGIDFRAFHGHVNFHLVQWNDPEEVIERLRRVYALVVERQRWLTKAGKSQWEKGNGPRILVVIDEFSTLADNLVSSGRAELWRWARMVAAEGRKSGVVLALALQDPTAQSIDLRIRRNCSAVALKVQDEAASRVIINAGGAEKLMPGHFLARVGGLQAGVTFKPTDRDIEEYLNMHPAASTWAVDWLEKIGTELFKLPETTTEKILRFAAEGLSMNEIQRRVFNGRTGGAFFNQVKLALAASTTNNTTTTESTDETGAGQE